MIRPQRCSSPSTLRSGSKKFMNNLTWLHNHRNKMRYYTIVYFSYKEKKKPTKKCDLKTVCRPSKLSAPSTTQLVGKKTQKNHPHPRHNCGRYEYNRILQIYNPSFCTVKSIADAKQRQTLASQTKKDSHFILLTRLRRGLYIKVYRQ